MKRSNYLILFLVLMAIAGCSSSSVQMYVVDQVVLQDRPPLSSVEEVAVFIGDQFFYGNCLADHEESKTGPHLGLGDKDSDKDNQWWRPRPAISRSKYTVVAELGVNGETLDSVIELLIPACRKLGANGLILNSSYGLYEEHYSSGGTGMSGTSPVPPPPASPEMAKLELPREIKRGHLGCRITALAVSHNQENEVD